jgi:hypothetical protein
MEGRAWRVDPGGLGRVGPEGWAPKDEPRKVDFREWTMEDGPPEDGPKSMDPRDSTPKGWTPEGGT